MKNPGAFVVLQDVFLRCKTEQLALLMMDVINVVFKYVVDFTAAFLLISNNILILAI